MNEIILVASVLFIIAALSSKIAGKLGIPALLIFIIVGIFAGSDGFGNIYFDNYYITQFVGIVALSYILFMGGLSVNLKEIKPVFLDGLSLATIGVFITAFIVGWLGHYFLNLNLYECLLLGSIVSSTDAAAVFSVLRSKDISLKNNLKPLLEFESGSNDPMAVFLTVGMISLITAKIDSFGDLILMFFQQMSLGILLGFLIGKGAAKLINKAKLEYSGLYVVLTIAIVGFAYALPSIIGGNGFMSVYICGLTLAGSRFAHKKILTKFHDAIAWFMQIIMFLMLGLLVFVKEVWKVAPSALLIALILIFIARPISVFIGMVFSKLKLNDKLMISWVGLRGAAPIVLATFPLMANIKHSHEIFNIVFFVVIISVIVQGTTIPIMAKLLKVDKPILKSGNSPLEFEAGESDKNLFDVQISPTSEAVGKTLKELELPPETLVTMLERNDKYLIPSGDTKIKENDIMFILSHRNNEDYLRCMFEQC